MAQVNDLLVLGKANFLNEITSSQLLKAFGGIALDSSTAESTSLPYFLGIKAFADGGNVVWSSPTNTANVIRLNASGTWPISISGLAAKATADGSGNTITSTYAKVKNWNDMIHSSNEYTFASPAYSGAIWLNYRTASGTTDGNITTYNFGNGKGGTAGVTLVATTFNGNATTANYATSAGNADTLDNIDSTGFLRYYNSNTAISSTEVVNTPSYVHTVSTTGGGITTSVKPSGMDNAWGLIHLHTHTGNYATQLGFGGTTGNLYMRNAYNSATFGSWKTILDSGNWTSIVDGRYLKLSGGTMTGLVSYKTTNYTSTPMAVYDDGTNYGHSLVIGAGGTTYIGAGEAASTLYSTKLKVTSTEDLILGADGSIRFHTNADNATTTNGVTLNTSNHFYPQTNNSGSVGTSGNKWGSMYATTFYGALSGNATTATSANALASTGYGNGNFTWCQTSGEFAGNSGWASYLISNHGDGSSYYHQIIAIPFWGPPKYRRMEGNTSTIKGWYDFITDENYTTKLDARYYTEAEADGRFVNVTGDSMTGTLSWGGNISSLNLRTGHASYDGVISYQTSGNEAMLFTTKSAVTSFMFVNGEDTITNMASDRWTKITPGLQIKENCVAIGKLIANGVTPTYKLEVAGMTYSSGRYLSETVPSSWIDGQRYNNGAYNVNTYSNDGSYNPWIRATNSHANVAKWFSFGTLGKQFYWIGSTTSRTSNGFDKGMTFNVESGLLYAPIVGGDRIYTGYDAGITGSVSCSNWFRSSDATGWYNASYGNHLYPNTVTGYGGFMMYGNVRGGYEGIVLGNSTSYMTLMSSDPHQGLYNEAKGRWIIYYNKTNNQTSVNGAQTSATAFPFTVFGATYIDGRLVVKGNGSSYNEGIRVLPASNGWSNLFFSGTNTVEGTHDGGWLIGRRGAAGSTYGAVGDFCIENNNSIGSNLTLTKAGILVNIGPIFGYRYKQTSNGAAFMWDKPGSHYTGMGANGSSDTIQFRACDAAGNWVDYRQHWNFYGDLLSYGARFANRGTSTSTSAYSDSAVEIREYNFGGAQSDTWGIAPRLSFHWAGRVAAQIGLASNGNLYVNNNASASTTFLQIVGMTGYGTAAPSGTAPTGAVYFKYI